MRKDTVVIRTYLALDLKRATKAYERDARVLAKDGYIPIVQTWEAGNPKGSLTMTYSLQSPPAVKMTRRARAGLKAGG